MCPTNIILFHRYHAEGYHAPSILHRLPRRGLPRPILTTTGYHACVYIPVTTPELSRFTIPRTSDYHTRHRSYFIVYLSPASTPPVLVLLHHHRAPHATTYSTPALHLLFMTLETTRTRTRLEHKAQDSTSPALLRLQQQE